MSSIGHRRKKWLFPPTFFRKWRENFVCSCGLDLLGNQSRQNWHFTEEDEFVKEHWLVKFPKYHWNAKHAKVLNVPPDITWSCNSRGGKRKVHFHKNRNIFEGKIHSVSCLTRSFLYLKRNNLRFLRLATEISFLFDFCMDFLLNPNPSSIFTMKEESMGSGNFVFWC